MHKSTCNLLLGCNKLNSDSKLLNIANKYLLDLTIQKTPIIFTLSLSIIKFIVFHNCFLISLDKVSKRDKRVTELKKKKGHLVNTTQLVSVQPLFNLVTQTHVAWRAQILELMGKNNYAQSRNGTNERTLPFLGSRLWQIRFTISLFMLEQLRLWSANNLLIWNYILNLKCLPKSFYEIFE